MTPAARELEASGAATVCQRGHIVGFLGDGVNDALALHAAHVGLSVDGATEVALRRRI